MQNTSVREAPTRYTEGELARLDQVPLDECEISVRLEGRLRTEAARRGIPLVVGSFARLSRSDRLCIERYGRKCEREFVGLVDALLSPMKAFGPLDRPEPTGHSVATISDTLAEQLFRDFLSNPIYNNMPFEDIARQARRAAGAFREVSERGVYGS